MRKVKFCLSTTNLPLSKAIRWFQGTDFSHSFIELESKYYSTKLIYEAKGFNSYIMNKKYFKGEVVYAFEAEVDDDKYFEIVDFIYEELGAPYAWKELIGFAAVKVCKYFGIKIKNPFPQKGKICSEACGEILVRFFGVTPDVGYDDMDLVWLSDKLLHHPQFKIVKG